jgi:chromosome segregation ATPase
MIEYLISAISSILLAVLTFFFTKRKYIAETKKARADSDSSEIDNADKMARMWREFSEEFKVRLEKDIEELRDKNVTMRTQLNEIVVENIAINQRFTQILNENQDLKYQMQSLEKELKASKTQINDLTSQNNRLLSELKKFNKNYTAI